MHKYFLELKKVGNRGYTQGFYFENNNSESYSYDISKGLAGSDFLCEFWDKKEDSFLVKTKNKFLKNQEIEIITPDEQYFTKVLEIESKKTFEELDVANTNDELYIKFERSPIDYKYALARTKEIKNDDVAS